MNTLIVWQEIPEETKCYVVPNDVADKYADLLLEAHNRYFNFDEQNEGMEFVNNALLSDEHINDDSYFPESYPLEKRCIFAKYKVSSDQKIDNVMINRVIITGFYI